MKEKSLKDWCKNWTLDEIGNELFTHGIKFGMAYGDESKSKEIQDEKWVLIKELKKRCK